METSTDRRRCEAFGTAVREVLRDRNVDVATFVSALGASDREVKGWLGGRVEPTPKVVFRIEALLSVEPGALSRRLGYVPLASERLDPPLADVVARCPLLDELERQIVLRVVNAFVARRQMRFKLLHGRGHPVDSSATTAGTYVGSPSLADLRGHWTEVLLAEGATRNTVENYRSALQQFRQFIVTDAGHDDARAIRALHIEEFLADQLVRSSPATAKSRYRALRVFFDWVVEIGLLDESPARAVRSPVVPRQPRGRRTRAD